jgi:flagellar assembly protein FliH
MVALVRSAVKRLGEARHVVLRLCPADAEALATVLAERGPGAVSPIASAQIEIRPDGSLERGDCVVEGDLASVDGRLSSRVEELRRALAEEILEDAQ